MATITKHRARKITAVGPPRVGYGDLSFPLLTSRKHVTITVGDHIMRVDWADAKLLAKAIGDVLTEYENG